MQGELITFRKMFGQSIAELSIIFKINMKGNLSRINTSLIIKTGDKQKSTHPTC